MTRLRILVGSVYGGALLTARAISVLTQLGHSAVTRMPEAQPSLRMLWQRAISANLLTG